MISVTHFMDRDGQVLANVGPRRHFCIDRQQGIAHELPDMAGVPPGWVTPPDLIDTRQQVR